MAKKKATTKAVTLEKAVPEFLKHLKENGKGERTVAVYGRCLENVVSFFGKDKDIKKLTPAGPSRRVTSPTSRCRKRN